MGEGGCSQVLLPSTLHLLYGQPQSHRISEQPVQHLSSLPLAALPAGTHQSCKVRSTQPTQPAQLSARYHPQLPAHHDFIPPACTQGWVRGRNSHNQSGASIAAAAAPIVLQHPATRGCAAQRKQAASTRVNPLLFISCTAVYFSFPAFKPHYIFYNSIFF